MNVSRLVIGREDLEHDAANSYAAHPV
jgi:hypothetical protein